MPYIVTVKRLDESDPGDYDGLSCERCGIQPAATCECELSRRAVATLEEARDACWNAINRAPWGTGGQPRSFARMDVARLPESGGTVGPLPDGTVIEVEQVSWADLRERAGLDRDGFTVDRITLEAFNARQA